MERHLSTGVATIVALMAAHRSAAHENAAPAPSGQDGVGAIEAVATALHTKTRHRHGPTSLPAHQPRHRAAEK